MDNSNSANWAQSCITSIGFPNTIHGVLEMLEGNRYKGQDLTDIDCLLQFTPADGTSWTSPKWLTEGDILFFYHTKRGALNSSRLRNIARKVYPKKVKLLSVLDHAVDLSKMYAGTIFGCAAVSGSTEYLGPPQKHFEGRIFAPLGRVQIFDSPLSSDTFADFVKISQNTITPVYSKEAVGIRGLLSKHNPLPSFLSSIEFGDNTFRNVHRGNWAEISCAAEARFIHEAQLRSYLLDYFLYSVKDERSPLLEECVCFRDGQRTGRVDYFVKIGRRWVPCEAKLSILSERNIFDQIAKYTYVDAFIPTKGPQRGKTFYADKSDICLVVDQTGLFVTSSREFVDCGYGGPIWQRQELGQITPSQLRRRIRQHV